MEMIVKSVNETQLEEVTELVSSGKGVIAITEDDVKSVLVGKVGVLYEAHQESGTDNDTFMRDFFDEVAIRGAFQSCTNMLICIGMSPDNPLLMGSMNIINNLFLSIDNEDLEVRWGIVENEAGKGMSIYAICTQTV